MSRTILFLSLFAGLVSTSFGQNLGAAKSSAEADLKDALARYATLQTQIKDEKIPLNRELNELNAQLREQRREASRSRRLRDNSSVDISALRERVEKRKEQVNYVANLVTDFGERFQRDIDLSERQVYETEMDQFQRSLNRVVEAEEFAKGEKLLDQLFMLETAVARFQDLAGGHRYEGRAVIPGGEVESGTFVAVGPTYYFASTESAFAGLSLKSNTSSLPPAVLIGADRSVSIAAVATEGKGLIPTDATLGSAFAIQAEADTLWEHVQAGGIWVWPIILFAVLATLTSIFKAFEIFTVKMPRRGALHEILSALNAGNRAEALALAQAIPGPTRAMLVDAVEHSDESKELVEEVMYERMLEVQPKLERMLPFIAVTAATAPLMGLLGTVTGMINTFEMIKVFGTGDAKQLSGGISEALITTEFGLVVAIPALVMHALLNRRAQGVLARMERMAVAFVNGLTRRN